MEIKDLSSNWKKLQEKLQSERKANEENLQPHYRSIKYRKKSHQCGERAFAPVKTSIYQNRMGSSWSSTKADAPSASLASWAEDNNISAKDLAEAYGTSMKSTSACGTETALDRINEGLAPNAEVGKYIAIDCEMVGVGPTPDTDSALARVSIVNYHGHQIYDSFVLPKEAVTDYRTHVSGITPELLREARTLEAVQLDIATLLDGRILIGHAIKNDLAVLLLGHSKRNIRDTSRHPAFRALAGGKTPGLKKLARHLLGIDIQRGEHSSVEDARVTMLLFRKDKQGFENEHLRKWGPDYKLQDNHTEHGNSKKKHRRRKKVKK
ncbi:3'-5' exonuclease [Lecanora helva]